MDSTQFDYKSAPNDAFRSNNIRPGTKGSQRPTSAQAPKFMYNTQGNQFYDVQPGHNTGYGAPNVGQGRNRPTTATSRQPGATNTDVTRNAHEQVIEELDAEEEARLVERTTYAQPVQFQQQYADVQKLIPRNVNVEKEKLYEDTLHLKQNINIIKEENLKLKTRNLNLERDNAKLSKALEKVSNPGVQYGNKPESALIVALKKQVKEAKEELKVRVDEIEGMKRSTKFTKVQELEIELKAFMDENLRLKGAYEELQTLKPQINPEDYSALEERCYLQNNLIESLQREHERLGAEVRYLQQENYSLQTTLDAEVNTTQKQRSEMSRIKKQLAAKEKELRDWQTYKPDLGFSQGATKTTPSKPLLNESHNPQTSAFTTGSGGKQPARPTTTTGKNKQPAKPVDNEKAALQAEIEKLKQQNTDLESRYKAVMGGKPQPAPHHEVERPRSNYKAEPKVDPKQEYKPEARKPEGTSELRAGRPESAKHEGRPRSAVKEVKQESKNAKLPRVRFDEAKQIVRGLVLGLKSKRIPCNKSLVALSKLGPQVTLGEISKALVSIGIKDEKEALLLARYIFEPSEELIELDLNRSQDIASVKSVLSELLGDYTLATDDQLKAAKKELSDILYRYEQSIDTQFSILDDDCNGHLTEERLVSAFATLDINLSQAAIDLLIGKLYEETGSLKKLNYEHVFELFETEEHKQVKEEMEKKYGKKSSSDSDDKKVKFREEDEDEDYELDDDQDEEYGDDDYEKDDDQ